jgi:hypothetical protein
MNITSDHISNILGGVDIPEYVKDRIEKTPLEYEKLSNDEYEKYLLDVLNVLFNPIVRSGEHRITEWESGWNENFEQFLSTKNVELLVPKYHGKYNYVRWMGEIVRTVSPNFDYNIHINFVDSVIESNLNGIKNVYEFGCGPGYHLLRMSDNNPDLNYYGLDWTVSSQNIINTINKTLDKNIQAYNFDFFTPDNNFKIEDNSLVYTVAALEQVGNKFKNFVDYLIEQSPDICIHFEPISELLDETKLLDYLSIKYFNNRNYLNGFLTYLEELELEGKIEILNKRRINSGSYFIEGHSLVVWRVKK